MVCRPHRGDKPCMAQTNGMRDVICAMKTSRRELCRDGAWAAVRRNLFLKALDWISARGPRPAFAAVSSRMKIRCLVRQARPLCDASGVGATALAGASKP